MPDHILPFARATTLFENVSSPSDEGAKRMLGKLYEVEDRLHGTGLPVILRAVQNDAAAAYTVPVTGSTQFMGFATTDIKKYGRKFSGVVAAQGAVGKALDDYYSAGRGPDTIPDHDVCFVVEEGPVSVLSTTTAYTMGQAVTIGSTGKAEQAATGNYIAGTAASSYPNTVTSIIMIAGRGLHATY